MQGEKHRGMKVTYIIFFLWIYLLHNGGGCTAGKHGTGLSQPSFTADRVTRVDVYPEL